MVKKKIRKKKVVKKKKLVKRGPSKITIPLGKDKLKKYAKAFRCDEELFELLNSVENASEFINNAVREAFSKEVWVTCPTCHGIGQIRENKRPKRKLR